MHFVCVPEGKKWITGRLQLKNNVSDVLYYKKKEKNNHPQNLSVETQKGKKYPQICQL